ncbi:hypothetical protein Syun_000148 [Stephania yunnanensis]|uniref:Solute carrier family 40 member n=1 Tax=Stephania yunnanensis TaxID=152371 RepID=A0AAP0Q5R1_9MAGN
MSAEAENMRQPLISNTEEGQQQTLINSNLIAYLYVGHFLSRWGARMWEFSVGLYMINIWPDSLLLSAVYGVVESASAALFGPLIGEWVDRFTYIKVLRLWLFSQSLSFVAAGVAVTVLLSRLDLRLNGFATFISLVILTNIAGAVGVLATLAGTILVEREWVVVIANGQSPEILTRMNSVIRRIDLICKLFAPVLTGFIVSFISLKASAVTLAIWSTLSVWLQYWLLMSVYKGVPSLSESNENKMARLGERGRVTSSPASSMTQALLSDTGTDSDLRTRSWKHKLVEWLLKIPCVNGWTVYLQQDIVLPGIALSLLFFTVLSFGTLMIATLQWKGIPAYVIGVMRGISAGVGIAGTLLYPVLHSQISTLRTGLWSIWTQWCFLLVCVYSVFIQNSYISAWILMGGVAASRIGLWMFDLSVMQQMQDQVPESDRCIVGGVQNSLQSTSDLLAYVMGVVVSNPEEFGKLTILSFLSVTVAAALYTLHIYRVRVDIFFTSKRWSGFSFG